MKIFPKSNKLASVLLALAFLTACGSTTPPPAPPTQPPTPPSEPIITDNGTELPELCAVSGAGLPCVDVLRTGEHSTVYPGAMTVKGVKEATKAKFVAKGHPLSSGVICDKTDNFHCFEVNGWSGEKTNIDFSLNSHGQRNGAVHGFKIVDSEAYLVEAGGFEILYLADHIKKSAVIFYDEHYRELPLHIKRHGKYVIVSTPAKVARVEVHTRAGEEMDFWLRILPKKKAEYLSCMGSIVEGNGVMKSTGEIGPHSKAEIILLGSRNILGPVYLTGPGCSETRGKNCLLEFDFPANKKAFIFFKTVGNPADMGQEFVGSFLYENYGSVSIYPTSGIVDTYAYNVLYNSDQGYYTVNNIARFDNLGINQVAEAGTGSRVQEWTMEIDPVAECKK